MQTLNNSYLGGKTQKISFFGHKTTSTFLRLNNNGIHSFKSYLYHFNYVKTSFNDMYYTVKKIFTIIINMLPYCTYINTNSNQCASHGVHCLTYICIISHPSAFHGLPYQRYISIIPYHTLVVVLALYAI